MVQDVWEEEEKEGEGTCRNLPAPALPSDTSAFRPAAADRHPAEDHRFSGFHTLHQENKARKRRFMTLKIEISTRIISVTDLCSVYYQVCIIPPFCVIC